MLDGWAYGFFAVLVVVIFLTSGRKRFTRERHARHKFVHMVQDGKAEPASLHPLLSPNRCISIGACATVCPEGDVIGVVNGRAELIAPNKCIGHGACEVACPVDAITLVFGTATRGIDIPQVSPNFETNAESIFIAGELGGMGLIRNAVTQGQQAMEGIAQRRSKDPAIHDVLIVGAGPAGLSATLQAEKEGVRYLTIDQSGIGGTILTYPRQKLVMTQPMDIPLHGKFTQREVTKEELLDLWNGIIDKAGASVSTNERLESIVRPNGHFEITTSRGQHLAKNILLAIGRRGTPRKLGVKGEDSSKVTYGLLEPEQYAGKRILVVGGGDSAVEAAMSLAEQEDTEVTLSYRKPSFGRIKEGNSLRIADAVDRGVVKVIWESNVLEIREDEVELDQNGNMLKLANDYVFVFAGGVLPTGFLKEIGVAVSTKYGEA